MYDVAVVGAGPAGLTAAAHLAKRGLRVAVIDEHSRAGGRLLGQTHAASGRPAGSHEWPGPRAAADLEAEFRGAGGVLLTGRTVWDVERGWVLYLSPGPDEVLRARALIVATGATERAIPIPGWTLPGVMTIGAAQVLTNVHQVAPGERVLVVGIDALALAVTGAMTAAGVHVVGAVLPPPGALAGERAVPASVIGQLAQAWELAPSVGLRLVARLLGGRSPSLAAHLARLQVIRVWGVPVLFRTACTQILGTDAVTSAILSAVDANGRLTGGTRRVDVDAVCISGGLSPLSDLARLAGCDPIEVPELGGPVPLHGPALETQVPGLFVAGNVVGVEAAPVAAAQGRLAAASALNFLVPSLASAAQDVTEAQELVIEARRSVAFSFFPAVADGHRHVQAVWSGGLPVRAVPRGFGRAGPPDLTVCRCEDVTLERIRGAFADGATAVAGVKKRVRAGMGRCQGRVCEDVVRRLAEGPCAEVLPRHRPRPPLRPVRLSDIART